MEGSALVYILLTMITVGLGLCVANRETAAAALRGGYAPGEYRPMSRERARGLVAQLAIYCLLTAVSACRIAVGNDYWVYRENFKLIAQERKVSSEFGFNLLVKALIRIFGYDNYLPIFALFSIVTVLFFVWALHDQGEHYAFSLFLLMTGGYYFNSLNSVRYYLAFAIALFSMKYVLRHEYGKFLLLILAGAAFHKSVLIVIPVYLAADYLARIRLKPWHALVFGAFVGSLLFGQGFYRWVIFKIYPYYQDSHFDSGRISYANLAKCACVLALCIIAWLLERDNQVFRKESLRFYMVLNLFGLVAVCCGSFVPEVTRIAFYMIAAQIFLLPQLVGALEKKWLRWLSGGGVIAAFTLYFGLLLRQMYSTDIRLLPYLNWIFN